MIRGAYLGECRWTYSNRVLCIGGNCGAHGHGDKSSWRSTMARPLAAYGLLSAVR
jgi:hypothetical protein